MRSRRRNPHRQPEDRLRGSVGAACGTSAPGGPLRLPGSPRSASLLRATTDAAVAALAVPCGSGAGRIRHQGRSGLLGPSTGPLDSGWKLRLGFRRACSHPDRGSPGEPAVSRFASPDEVNEPDGLRRRRDQLLWPAIGEHTDLIRPTANAAEPATNADTSSMFLTSAAPPEVPRRWSPRTIRAVVTGLLPLLTVSNLTRTRRPFARPSIAAAPLRQVIESAWRSPFWRLSRSGRSLDADYWPHRYGHLPTR